VSARRSMIASARSLAASRSPPAPWSSQRSPRHPRPAKAAGAYLQRIARGLNVRAEGYWEGTRDHDVSQNYTGAQQLPEKVQTGGM
jgi:hypothetical protein